MKMSALSLFLIILCCGLVAVGALTPIIMASGKPAAAQATDIAVESINSITIGNKSYVPVRSHEGRAGYVLLRNSDAVQILADAVAKFQKQHPELEVVSGQFEKDVDCDWVYGVWIHHQPAKTHTNPK